MQTASERISLVLFIAFLLCLPLSKALVSITVVLLLVIGWIRSDRQQILQLTRSPMVILPMVYFGWHLVSLCWSDNLGFGLFDLQIKIMLVVVPLMFGLHAKLFSSHRILLYRSYYLGCAATVLLTLMNAAIRFSSSGSVHAFFYTDLSIFMHPTYFACYIDIAILLLLMDAGNFTGRKSYLKWLLLSLFTIAIILLNSKAGIIGWFIVTVGMIAWQVAILRNHKQWWQLLVYPFCFLLLMRLLIPASEDRMAGMQQAVEQGGSASNVQESSSTRLDVWKTSWSLIRSMPLLGTGAGDVKDQLVAAYEARGLDFAAAHRFNSHNQFLQSWLATGIIGFLLLLLIFFYPTIRLRYFESPAWMLFILLSGFNMLVESMLEKQDGVVFFALFYSVFLTQFPVKKPA